VLAKASRFRELFAMPNQPFKPLAKKVRFDVTPKPTRETCAPLNPRPARLTERFVNVVTLDCDFLG
jgi:hypothetical protein